ncbi:hypothetical protein [Polluticoccus soli]|uniref:hypothetical protein n=1 Tax=Polluticoccus soli TaxID=3034150 RepID=UPI0023E130D0|nr:hypothetical protein [Flavipsychrobacter sp. JY13-12]
MKKILLAAVLLGTILVQSCSVGRESYKTGRDPHFHGGYRDVQYKNNYGFPGR